jgi:hypothetical protein
MFSGLPVALHGGTNVNVAGTTEVPVLEKPLQVEVLPGYTGTRAENVVSAKFQLRPCFQGRPDYETNVNVASIAEVPLLGKPIQDLEVLPRYIGTTVRNMISVKFQ